MIFPTSAVVFDLMSSMVTKRVPLRPIFRVGNSQKSLEARSESQSVAQDCFSGRQIAAQQALCGSVRYRDAGTSAPATCPGAS
jgi:hypothetical protein